MEGDRMKWEYLVKYLRTNENDYLNQLGKEGWELVSVVWISGEKLAYFKRPIQPKSEAEILAHFDKPRERTLVEGDEKITLGGPFIDKDSIRGFGKRE